MTVELFTTPTCKYCHLVKDFLSENRVQFAMYDISKDHVQAQRLFEMTSRISVPITLVKTNGIYEVIIGSNINRLKEVLNL